MGERCKHGFYLRSERDETCPFCDADTLRALVREMADELADVYEVTHECNHVGAFADCVRCEPERALLERARLAVGP